MPSRSAEMNLGAAPPYAHAIEVATQTRNSSGTLKAAESQSELDVNEQYSYSPTQQRSAALLSGFGRADARFGQILAKSRSSRR
jgi:hypothetical protein